ncbi:glutathione gamma-glutamylcysteinyltransferase-like isoform X2 [Rhopilema esculentum]|uniref:glutathione gamma-glutamylcysteinyltransferase-like isoform X2 n=1 Tax=Rhopilema esculentum TaxID=499914 RepID=UPI0031D263F7
MQIVVVNRHNVFRAGWCQQLKNIRYIIRSQQGRLQRELALSVPQKRTIFNMPSHRFYVRFGKLAKFSALEEESIIEQIEYLKPRDRAKMAVPRSFDVSVKQFYRRPLPETCISFCSQKGKEIFKEALVSGHMQSYFRLAAQFRTQDEPAYCGLSTLVMVLNSLEVDPGKLWKGCWRWYHEEMLDCCEPLDHVKEKGINFDQFVCLAHCNYLKADAVRGNEDMLEENFRELVKICTQQDDSFIVASYSRSTLLQTGEGHFSPIAGYHPGQDLVLILDVARFKYPPHWVSLKLLVKAMRELDLSTGLPRGYILLQKQEGRLPLLLFRISTALAVTQGDLVGKGVRECIRKWNELLAEKRGVVADFAENKMILGQAISGLLQVLGTLPEDCCVLTTQST